MKFLSFLLNGKAKFGTYNKKYITDLTGKIKGALTLKDLISKPYDLLITLDCGITNVKEIKVLKVNFFSISQYYNIN